MSCSAEDGIPNAPIANVPADGPPIGGERSPLLAGRDNRAAIVRRGRITLAALYAIQVFYSFFIMWVRLTETGVCSTDLVIGFFS